MKHSYRLHLRILSKKFTHLATHPLSILSNYQLFRNILLRSRAVYKTLLSELQKRVLPTGLLYVCHDKLIKWQGDGDFTCKQITHMQIVTEEKIAQDT